MRVCIELNDIDSPIKLEQRRVNCFKVTYGKQVDDGLTYAQAAAKLGEAVMHALACVGKLNNG